MYKHLMIIDDGESVENSLHLTDRARAEHLIELLEADEIGVGGFADRAVDIMAEIDAATNALVMAEDYVDALRDLLSDNGYDLYLDDLDRPGEPITITEVSTT